MERKKRDGKQGKRESGKSLEFLDIGLTFLRVLGGVEEVADAKVFSPLHSS